MASSARPRIVLGDCYLPLAAGRCEDSFVLVEGNRGTGKTRAILSVVMARALRYPGSRWLLARSTRTRLSQSVLVTLEEQVFPAFGMEVPGEAQRGQRTEYRLPNGSLLIPMGLDDQQRTQSVEVSGIYVAEAVELPRLEDVTALAGAMRQHVPGMDGHQCIVDCNPGAPGHWLNEIAEPVPVEWRNVQTLEEYRRLVDHAAKPAVEGRWKRVVTRHQDNPHYFDVTKWEWTKAGSAYLKTLEYLTGFLRKRWLDGVWAAAEGSVFPEFDPARHVVAPMEIPDSWPVVVGIDPGYDHPCAILWFAASPNGTVYVVDELYRRGKSVQEHAEAIALKSRGRTVRSYYGDPQHAFSRTAQSPKSIAEQFAECRWPVRLMRWPRSTNKEAMVEGVRELLRTDRLKVSSECRATIREFQTWAYRRTPGGELPKGDDQFEDRDNDCMDVVCGVVATDFWKSIGGYRVTLIGRREKR
jgi:phage terminase large subunit